MTSHHKFCVLCAKTDELREVIAVFNKHFEKRRREQDHLTDQVYAIPGGSDGGEQTVIVTTCVGMGHMNAAVRTAEVINSHQPSVLIFTGTAATLKPSEIQIGDVVIPRKAIMRIYEKVSQKGQKDHDNRAADANFKELFFGDNALISDLSAIECSAQALGAIAGIPISEIELEGGPAGSVKIGEEEFRLREPQVFDDVDIFSCGMVIDSVSYRTFINSLADSSMRKVGIIDMESYGFFKAIEASRSRGVGTICAGIMIRGISDYAGRKSDTEALPAGWKPKSVRNAALVAQRLIAGLAGA